MMYRMLLMTAIVFSFKNLHSVAPQEFSFNRSLRSSSALSPFNNPTYIFTTTVITSPGIYAINRNIVFVPDDYNQSCITIDSNDVVLDLNLKTISQDETTMNFTGINGIEIALNRSNIIIRNGSFNSLSGSALVIRDNVEIADIFDLTILRMGFAGIFIDGLSTGSGVASVSLSNIDVEHTGTENNGDAYGFLINNVSTMNIETCVCSESVSATGQAYGMFFNTCDSIRVKSSIANNNTAGGNKAAGVSVVNSNNLLFLDCIAANNLNNSLLPTSTCCGFEFQSSVAVFLQGCTASSNKGLGSVYGFFCDGCRSSRFEKVQALSNVSEGSSSHGFYSANGTGNLITKSELIANNGTLNGFGVLLLGNGIGEALLENTVVANIGITGTSFGVFVDDTVNNSGILNNFVVAHQGPSYGFGLYDEAADATSNRYLANDSIDNIINYNMITAVAPLFTGPLTDSPGEFQNVSL